MSGPDSKKENWVIGLLCFLLVLSIYNHISSDSESDKKIKELEQTIDFYKSPSFRDDLFVCMANQRRFYEGDGSPSDQLFAKWYDSEYGNLDKYCEGPQEEVGLP